MIWRYRFPDKKMFKKDQARQVEKLESSASSNTGFFKTAISKQLEFGRLSDIAVIYIYIQVYM